MPLPLLVVAPIQVVVAIVVALPHITALQAAT